MAKEVELEDKFENMGAQMIKEVASKTSDVAGDGTTTATVLAEAIYREGLKNVTAGANSMALEARHRPWRSRPRSAELKKMSKKTTGREEIMQVAAISANNDKEIGKLIADAMEKVGKEGVITVEEAKSVETTLEVVEGMQFDRGYLSPYFALEPGTTTPAEPEDGSDPRGHAGPALREEDLVDARPAAGAREGRPEGQADPDHRRGSRGRGAGRAGRQPHQGHAALLRREGPGLRRPPAGDARGHRRADRRQADLRGPRHQARERPGFGPRRLPSASSSTKRTRPSSRARARRPTSPAASSRSGSRSRRPSPTTTKRSCRSGWPSWPAALRSSTSALPPKSR